VQIQPTHRSYFPAKGGIDLKPKHSWGRKGLLEASSPTSCSKQSQLQSWVRLLRILCAEHLHGQRFPHIFRPLTQRSASPRLEEI